MTKAAQRIADIAEKLSPAAQQTLLDVAEVLAQPSSFFAGMSKAQQAELTRSLGEADRGETIDDADLDRELEALLAGRS